VAAQEKPIAEELSLGSDAKSDLAAANGGTDELANANADDSNLDESDMAFTQPTALRHVCVCTACIFLPIATITALCHASPRGGFAPAEMGRLQVMCCTLYATRCTEFAEYIYILLHAARVFACRGVSSLRDTDDEAAALFEPTDEDDGPSQHRISSTLSVRPSHTSRSQPERQPIALSPPHLGSSASAGSRTQPIVQRKRKAPSSAGPNGSAAETVSQAVPSQALPSQALPSQALPSQALPSQALPSQSQSQSSASPPFISRAERLQRVALPVPADADTADTAASAGTHNVQTILKFLSLTYAEQSRQIQARAAGYHELLARRYSK
jgi:hypothetical protein